MTYMTYDESLRMAAEIAAAWPAWKRGLLGTIKPSEGKQMKLNDLVVISDAAERISKATGVNAQAIIDALVGTAWDKEDAGRIKEALS